MATSFDKKFHQPIRITLRCCFGDRGSRSARAAHQTRSYRVWRDVGVIAESAATINARNINSENSREFSQDSATTRGESY